MPKNGKREGLFHFVLHCIFIRDVMKDVRFLNREN